MDVQEREAFVKAWLNGWNERDLERIISHYADDVEFQSPFAVHLLGEAWRTITGKENLTHYFERVLTAVPGKIEFELLASFTEWTLSWCTFSQRHTNAPSSWN